jgi:erythromycin esterase-like protein
LRDHAAPWLTLDPDEANTCDLRPLGAAIGDARVVCIGESTHLNREFYLLKDRLFRFLASEHGFTAFVLESGLPEGWRMNDWVHGDEGDLHELTRQAITFGLGDCDEMRSLLRWMRNRNATHDRQLSFYGMDIGGSSSNPGTSVRACLARLPAEPGDDERAALTELGVQNVALARWVLMSASERERLVDLARGLVDRAQLCGDELARLYAASAQIICRGMSAWATGASQPHENPRDAFMAETVQFLLAREERILVAAHNAHISRAPVRGRPMLGSFLSAPGFPSTVVIGATAAAGDCVAMEFDGPRIVSASTVRMQAPSDSIDAIMSRLGTPPQMLDLRRLPAGVLSEPVPMMFQGEAVSTPVRRSFDILVDVGAITLADGMLGPLKRELDEANRLIAAAR